MKIVVFDFDGTLTKSKKGSNCWRRVWEHLGDVEKDDELYNMYANKEITNQQWFDLINISFSEKGLKKQAMQTISNDLELIDGAKETLKTLYQNGIKIFILSGGVKQIIENTLTREDLLKYVEKIEAYDFKFDKDDNFTHFVAPKHNLDDKSEYVNMLLIEFKISGKDVLFVGNDTNDEDVYKSGAVTLCINPHHAKFQNKEIWNYAIEHCNNLKEILKFADLNKSV